MTLDSKDDKEGNSWKIVITSQGRTVTATAKTQQESKRRAKEKIHQLPAANNGKVLGASKVTLGEYLLPWLDFQHKNAIASTTYRRYRGLAVRNIVPALGPFLCSSNFTHLRSRC